MKLDLDLEKEKTLTLDQLLKICLLCLAIGAVTTVINPLLGLMLIGGVILYMIFPIILKLTEKKKE